MKHLEEHKIKWLDTQMVTDVVKNFGGTEISRPQYLDLLQKSLTQEKSLQLFIN